jgi:hypothetical protein
VRKLLVGNTAYIVFLKDIFGEPRGTVAPIFYPHDRRRLSYTTAKQKFERLWWIEGDAYCSQAADLKMHNCTFLYDQAGTLIQCHREDKRCNFLIRVVPGNPENL